jgi:hypothetical protein
MPIGISRSIVKALLAPAIVGVGLAAASGNASSADFIFDLVAPNTAISSYTGPYATVDVHLVNSTTATVTFSSIDNLSQTFLMGDGGTVGVNGNFTLAGASATNSISGFTASSLSFNACNTNAFGCITGGGVGNEDGFGSFNVTLDTHDGYTDAWNSVILNLTASGSTTWSDASQVLIANSLGAVAAAHIYVAGDPVNASNLALATGYAASVPETETWAMMLAGLGLVGLQLRRRNAGQHVIHA